MSTNGAAPPPGGDRGARDFREAVVEAIQSSTAGRKGSGPAPLIGIWGRAASTNDLAKVAAADGAHVPLVGPAGSVFVAEEQTGGKGRYGRRWVSPRGGLYASLLIRPPGDTPEQRIARLSLLPIAAGVAVAEAVEQAAGVRVAVRWPNDLDLPSSNGSEPRKVAGVLAETGFLRAHPELAVVGFGINCGPVEIPVKGRGGGKPLRAPGWLPGEVDRARLAGALVTAFREVTELWGRSPAELRARWESLSPLAKGCACRVRMDPETWITGTTAGLHPEGGLRVELDGGGMRVIHASEAIRVHHDGGSPEPTGRTTKPPDVAVGA